MDDEDVFDSVTWESPSAPPYTLDNEQTSSGPGFRQSTTDGNEDPKWEGYLITNVKDPVKELAETKDAYVSYLVMARVCRYKSLSISSHPPLTDQLVHILNSQSFIPQTLPGFRLSTRESRQRLSGLRCTCLTGKTSAGSVLIVHFLLSLDDVNLRVHHWRQVQSRVYGTEEARVRMISGFVSYISLATVCIDSSNVLPGTRHYKEPLLFAPSSSLQNG